MSVDFITLAGNGINMTIKDKRTGKRWCVGMDMDGSIINLYWVEVDMF